MKDINFLSLNCALALFFVLIFTGCVDPYSNNSGYNSPNYGGYNGGYNNGYDHYDENRRERREIERERQRLEDERRRLEEERRHNEPVYRPPPPPPAREPERCPSGFSPSENKCSSEERRHGCKDMRLPSGLGCVRR